MKLVADNLACIRGGRTIFENVSFALAAGEAMKLTGPNGAGKTTLLRVVAGLLDAAGGTVTMDLDDQDDDELSIGQRAHFVGHLDAVKTGLSVRENLEFWMHLLGKGDIARGLGVFGLDAYAEFPAALLSAGQRRRLALSRLALVARPLWLLDEPDASLDAASRRTLAAAIGDHVAAGGMVIASSHVDLGLEFARSLDLGPGKAAA